MKISLIDWSARTLSEPEEIIEEIELEIDRQRGKSLGAGHVAIFLAASWRLPLLRVREASPANGEGSARDKLSPA